MTDTAAPFSKTRLLAGPPWQFALGIMLLALWITWWSVSLSREIPCLYAGQNTHMNSYAWPYIGIDFIHEYCGGSTFAQGNNPYIKMTGHPMYQKFTYPPVILPFFAWCALLPTDGIIRTQALGQRFSQRYPYRAVLIWTGVLSVIFSFAAYTAWRARRALGYGDLALPLVLGAFLLSFPVVFAMERGSSDALMLLLILMGVAAVRRKTLIWDIAAGLCFAVAAWMKLYPAFLILALLALRRWRVSLLTFGGIVLIGLVTLPWVLQWIDVVRSRLNETRVAVQFGHSLSGSWNDIWSNSALSFMTLISGKIGAGIVVLIMAGVVSWFVYRQKDRDKLILPYILWMTALATYWPVLSFDYNLFYLPLAALIVWRRRDPFWVHMLMAYYLVEWQPWLTWQTPVTATIVKLAGVFAVGMSLVYKLREENSTPIIANPIPSIATPPAREA